MMPSPSVEVVMPESDDHSLFHLEGYYTVPHLKDLRTDDSKQPCLVDNFLVGRHSHGKIKFLGTTDVTGITLNDILTIDGTEVELYPDDDAKPPVGEGLNKTAIITLQNVWSDSPETCDIVEGSEFEDFLRARVAEMDYAEFLTYSPECGELAFRVPHFSKYTLDLTRKGPAQSGRSRKSSRSSEQFSTAVSTFIPCDSLEILQNQTKSSEDSSKENSVPCQQSYYAPDECRVPRQKRKSFDDMTESFGESENVTGYFEGLPDDDSGQLPSDRILERVRPARLQESDYIVSSFVHGRKGITGAIATDTACLTHNLGEALSRFRVPATVELTGASKILMEDMLECYLAHCRYEEKDGESVILPPETSAAFIGSFCDTALQSIGTKPELVNEKLMWGLFRALYTDVNSTDEKSSCGRFVEWMRSAVKSMHPIEWKDGDVRNAPKMIFESILCGDLDRGLDIAHHFEFYMVELRIQTQLQLRGNIAEHERLDVKEALEAVEDYLEAKLKSNVKLEQNDPENYIVKSLLLLNGVLNVSCESGGKISVCEGLDWFHCLAACAVLATDWIPTGMSDILRKYTEQTGKDPHCSLPSETALVPALFYHMIEHFCRFSLSEMKTVASVESLLLNDHHFDIRFKWFFMRVFASAVGSEPDRPCDLSVTSDFVGAVLTAGYYHACAVALLHLTPNRSRKNEIRRVLHLLADASGKNPERYKPVYRFLSDDLKLAPADLAEAQASWAESHGNLLEAAYLWYQSGSVGKCRDIITDYALPMLLLCDGNGEPNSNRYAEILDALSFMNSTDKSMEPYGGFLVMLNFMEDLGYRDNDDGKTFRALSAQIEVLEDSLRLFPDTGRKSKEIARFARHKMELAKRMLECEWKSELFGIDG